MAGERRLRIEILGDARGLSSALGEADGAVSRLGSGIAKFAKAAAVAFTGAAVAGGVFAKSAVDAASDLNENLSKANTIFGDNAKAIEDWASTAARSFGQSKSDALAAAGTFGNLFDQLGFGSGQTADMSKQMTELASDFASFHNADITEVIEAQTAAFRGEYDALQRYVPTINAAAVEQRALQLTGKKTTKELTAQDKALATHTLMLEGAGEALGDFDRTSDSFANRQRTMSAQFEDIKAKIGQFLLPAFSKAVGFISNKVIPGVERLIAIFEEDGLGGVLKELGRRFSEAWPDIRAALLDMGRKLVETLGEWGRAFVEWVGPRIGPMLNELATLVGKAADWLFDPGLGIITEKLIEWGQAFVDWVGPQIPPLLRELAKLLAQIGEWILTTAVPKLVENALKLAWALTNWVWDLSIDILKGLGQMLVDLAAWVVSDGIPKLAGEGLKLAFALRDAAVSALNTLITEKLPEWAGQLIGFLAGLPRQLYDWAVNIGEKVVEYIVKGIREAPLSISAALAEKVPGYGVVFGSGDVLARERAAGRIKPRHTGGIFRAPTPGGEGLALLRDGERVVTPAHAAGMGGNTIIVNALDPRAAAEAVVTALRQAKLQGFTQVAV